MAQIILASKSPYRKQLLEQLGIEFDCMDAQIDEGLLKQTISDPVQLTRELALQKALAVSENRPNSLIIGSDQVCYFKGKIFGKTGSYEGSFAQLKILQGSPHELITSYVIINNEKRIFNTVKTTLYMRDLDDLQIKNYLSTDNPIDCAGSYKLEKKGISLFSKIETPDHTAIIGLPLIGLGNDLKKFGIVIPPRP